MQHCTPQGTCQSGYALVDKAQEKYADTNNYCNQEVRSLNKQYSQVKTGKTITKNH